MLNILVIRETSPFFTSSATFDTSASNNRFLSLAEGLVENGCNIDLLICNGFYHKSERLRFGESGSFNKINYKYLLPLDCSNVFVRRFFNNLTPIIYYKQIIIKYLKKKKYDFIWLTFGKKQIKIGLNLFNYKLGIKYFHERSEFSWIGLSSKRLHEKYLREFLPRIDILAIMTNTLLNYYKDFIGENTKMIHVPMTVDFSRFKNTINNNKLKKPYIAYCGTMNNKKDGVDILIQAFIKIMKTFPNLYLYLAGPLVPLNDYLQQKKIIKENNAEDRIIYLGNLDREEITAFLLNAKVLALARPQSKQAEGGFPTKLGEYLATGNPVCVTDVGEIKHYLVDNKSAYFAIPNSIESFADALIRALTSKNAKNVGEEGKNIALKYFNKDIQAKKLYKLLIENK
jgi:glycosyltransferase involved in cell wall biosynthesis